MAGGRAPKDIRTIQWSALVVVSALTTVALLTAMTAAKALAEVPHAIGSHGTGAGQLQESHGIAADQSSGDLYLVDSHQARVDEFGGEGAFVRAWGWGVVSKSENVLQACTQTTGCVTGNGGGGAGQLGEAEGVAVDNTAGISSGDVYVVDTTNNRVEKYGPEGRFILMFGGEVNATKDSTAASQEEKDVCTQEEIELDDVECGPGVSGEAEGQFVNAKNAIAVNAKGEIYVGDASRVQSFSEAGKYEATVLSGAGMVEGLAAAPDGDLYVLSSERAGVREYEPDGTEVGPARDEDGNPRALAIDGEGNLFLDDEQSGVHRMLEYDAAGVQVASFDLASSELDAERGVVDDEKVDTLDLVNHVFGNGAEIDDVRTVARPAAGPTVIPPVSASAQPHHREQIKALIDPENAETEYFVRYGTGEPLSNATAIQTLPASFEEPEVTVELDGLPFSTEYHYCLIAVNANSKGVPPCQASEQSTFLSAPATAIDAEWSSQAAGASVTLSAEIDPEDTATACRFEYKTAAAHAVSSGFEHALPTSTVADPEEGEVTVSAHIGEGGGLRAGVEYDYRLGCEKESVLDDGAVQSFRSQLGHAGAGLPDARALELVATDVNGAGLAPPQAGLPQAAEDGQALAYLRRAPSSAGALGGRAPEPTVDMARHLDAWRSTDITTPYSATPAVVGGKGTEYRLFDGDLSASVITPWDAAPLAGNATERTPYRRSEASGAVFYEPLLTASDVAAGVQFGGEGTIEIEGANPSLTAVVLSSQAPLSAQSVPKALYEWSAGQLSPVSVLPQEEGGETVAASLGDDPQGEHRGNARGAVSMDGSLVFFEHGANLYVRDTRTGESLRLDVPRHGVAPQSGEVESAEFQIASADGSHVFFTDTQRLTSGATARAGAPDLYECTISIPLACGLSDVTEQVADAGESADVQGLVAAIDQGGSRVFFVAKGVLAPGANAGEDNLYTATDEGGAWAAVWIATLSTEDGQDWDAGKGTGVLGLGQLTERSSPDGHFFAFMSQRSLTGYDNLDVLAGVPDEEVYLYDAQTGRLACVSCDPTGDRPRGVLDEGKALSASVERSPIDVEGVWSGHRLAGILPGWQNLTNGGGLTAYQPRSLSDSGRLFFESPTPLSPQAVNGAVDVYEFEPVGVGSCTPSASGYASAVGGCVALISPGTAAGDAVFLDASANGDDVFVMSRSGGVTTEDGLAAYSVLDAHSCEAGTSWTCAPPSPVAATGCEPAGCKSEGESSVADLGAAPVSSLLSGAGNLVKPPTAGKRLSAHRRTQKGACRSRARRIRARGGRHRALARCSRRRVGRRR